MLTKEDLKWTYKCLSLYSKLGIIPVTFKPAGILGEGAGEMRTGEVSIWKRVGFKLTQTLFTSQTLFISFRTLEYVTQGVFLEDGGQQDTDLDWDLVPMLLIFTDGYLTFDVTTHFIFDFGRQLNAKIYNEILKLRGESKAE